MVEKKFSDFFFFGRWALMMEWRQGETLSTVEYVITVNIEVTNVGKKCKFTLSLLALSVLKSRYGMLGL